MFLTISHKIQTFCNVNVYSLEQETYIKILYLAEKYREALDL